MIRPFFRLSAALFPARVHPIRALRMRPGEKESQNMQDDHPIDETETPATSNPLQDAERTARIRELNDALRTELRGNGQIMITGGHPGIGRGRPDGDHGQGPGLRSVRS